MHTLTTDTLVALLRRRAAGSYADEAAVELLIAHATWLGRRDFLTTCVDYDHDGHHPVVWVDWHAVPGFLDRAPCSASEARILRLAAELSGIDTGTPLADLLCGLDDRNRGLVVDAIRHALQVVGR
ncbi:MAG TPA: hypothetical protein VFZ68_17075 [Acidimicrobiales bacterium]